jgi:hypothetical protein
MDYLICVPIGLFFLATCVFIHHPFHCPISSIRNHCSPPSIYTNNGGCVDIILSSIVFTLSVVSYAASTDASFRALSFSPLSPFHIGDPTVTPSLLLHISLHGRQCLPTTTQAPRPQVALARPLPETNRPRPVLFSFQSSTFIG